MRFAQLENNKVTTIIEGIDYKILPPDCIELSKLEAIEIGNIYENGEFRESTAADTEKEFRPIFNAERSRLFDITAWVRERHFDRLELLIDDTDNWAAWLNYWQKLRDMPADINFNAQFPIFPDKPE